MNDISIKIKAILDQTASTGNIESQIKQIQKKLDNSPLKLKLDENSIKNTFDKDGKLTKSIYKVNDALNGHYTVVQKASKVTGELETAQIKLSTANDKAGQSFSNILKKIGTWGVATGILYGGLRQISTGVDYIIELDNSMNEVQIVTGYTKEKVDALAQSYNELGKQMKVTTSEIAATSADLYRQGLTDAEVTDRMKGIIEYAKISSISLEDSNKIITATANATERSIENITDIFAYLGDTTA